MMSESALFAGTACLIRCLGIWGFWLNCSTPVRPVQELPIVCDSCIYLYLSLSIIIQIDNNKNSNPSQTTDLQDNMKVSASKAPQVASMQKKAELLRQKILTTAAITHNKYQHRIDEMTTDLEEAEARLTKMVTQFQTKAQDLVDKYQSDMTQLLLYYQTDGQNIKDTEINSAYRKSLRSDHVKSYLNNEKSLLKQILQRNEHPERNSKEHLHTMVRRKHLQQILETIQLSQLERQVRYLSTHVINSSGLIYVPEGTVTDAEEEQLNQKLAISYDEVQRLLNLETVCLTSNMQPTPKPLSNFINLLDEQEKRLATLFQMLADEKEDCGKLEARFEQQAGWIKNIPKYVGASSKPQVGIQKLCLISPSPAQLEDMRGINLEQHEDMVSNQSWWYEQLNNNLKVLRNKLKKIQ